MDYHCRHCGEDLDAGDIYEVLLQRYGDPQRAFDAARMYGWSEIDRIHFKKSVIVQSEGREQWEECPKCKGRDPLKPADPRADETP
jgi:hypothetical protein